MIIRYNLKVIIKLHVLPILLQQLLHKLLQGVDKEWPTLTALITHHTVMPELLPCHLKLNSVSRNPSFSQQITDEV